MFCESEKKLESLANYIGKPNKTNCYLTYFQLKQMLEMDDIRIEFGQKCTYIFKEKHGYIELFFFVNEMMDLLEARDFLMNILPSNKKIVTSIISKDKKHEEHQQIIERLGFSLYKKYLRKKLQINDNSLKVSLNESVCLAEVKDIEVIQTLMNKTFDDISDQIPSGEELEQMVSQKQVLKYMIMNCFAGFLINERQGKKSYLRMLCIEEKYRGSGIGKNLLWEYITSEYKNVDLFYLWVDEQNEKALELYAKQGYISDGVEQYIYIR